MLELRIDGFPDIQRQFNNLSARQLPFALRETVNRTAFAAQQESRRILETTFDRPTPMIKGATRVVKATKQNLTAIVRIDPKRERILKTHELGGGRGKQRLEQLLSNKGWLPSGWRAVPTDNMPTDAFGNPQRKEINRIIRHLTASISGISSDRRRYFVVPPNTVNRFKPGIYRDASTRARRTVVTLYLFTPSVHYDPVLQWCDGVYNEALRVVPTYLYESIQYALDTSR